MRKDVRPIICDEKDLIPPGAISLTKDGATGLGTFQARKVELAAGRLVSFFKATGGMWRVFSIVELLAYYEQQGWDPNDMFFGLCGAWFDDEDPNQPGVWTECAEDYLAVGRSLYHVTNRFIEKCSTPARRAA